MADRFDNIETIENIMRLHVKRIAWPVDNAIRLAKYLRAGYSVNRC